jgi:hypothetical protein
MPILPNNDINASDAGLGSGQNGSGLALSSNAAQDQPLARDELDALANASEHDIVTRDAIRAVGATAEDAMTAAMAANNAPAPTSALEQQLAALHIRMSELENLLNTFDLHARVSALETSVDRNHPLLQRIEKALNTHFQGKI